MQTKYGLAERLRFFVQTANADSSLTKAIVVGVTVALYFLDLHLDRSATGQNSPETGAPDNGVLQYGFIRECQSDNWA